MKKTIFQIALVFFLVTLCVTVFAQPPGGGVGGGVPTGGNPPAAVPIDGGVTALLAGVIGYAYKQLKGRKEA